MSNNQQYEYATDVNENKQVKQQDDKQPLSIPENGPN